MYTTIVLRRIQRLQICNISTDARSTLMFFFLMFLLIKAFDMVRDQKASLETIIQLGFDRVLTSGGESNTLEGASRLKELIIQV